MERPKLWSEHTEKSIGKKLFKVLAVSFLASLPQNARAVEMRFGSNWSDGVSKLVYSVYKDPNETSALFVSGKGFEDWVTVVEGGTDSVVHSQANHVEEVEQLENAIADEDSVNVCRVHTHTLAASDKYYYGPSGNDIQEQLTFSARFNEATSENVDLRNKTELSGAVVDYLGVWYFSVSSDADANPNFLSRLSQIESMRSRGSVAVEDIDLNETAVGIQGIETWLPSVQELYDDIDVKVRFVSHDELQHEPPCAGPDYVPDAV